jgi:plasmid stabilization system protein ParE
MNYIVRDEAAQDLESIWEYLADSSGEGAANKVIDRILAECGKVAQMPGIGHFRRDLVDQRHRVWNVWSYLIIYHCDLKPIEVLAVVHGARRLGALLRKRTK